ncbi:MULTISPECIES: hypothetical protein [Streptomyces]|uniref:Lipoprotein n=2 Tax=Streptomyces TaxID=1883 RepID=A0ABV9JCC8_9ACTN
MSFILKGVAWPAVAAAGVLALAGCSQGGDGPSASSGGITSSASGGSASSSATSAKGDLAIPADADDETRKAYVAQNALAACMRAKGFTYTPHVMEYDDSLKDVDGQDYEAAKKFRNKYGFGLYAGAVYRNDPNVQGSEAYNKKDTSPDTAYRNALTPAQKKAYDKALGGRTATGLTPGCQKEAEEKAYGPEKSKAEIDKKTAEDKERALAAKQALNGDSELVTLAQQFASCLTKQGFNVTTTQPTEIGDMVKFQLSGQTPPNGILALSKSEATAKLTQEIGLAKKDLECGKDFRAAYFPKLAKHPFEDVTG